MSIFPILVIDDDLERSRNLRFLLEFIDYDRVALADRDGWAVPLADGPIEAVLLGQCGSNRRGREILDAVAAQDTATPVLLLDAEDVRRTLDTETAAAALYRIAIPFRCRQLTEALRRARLYRESKELSVGGRPLALFRSLVGNSLAMRTLHSILQRVAASETTVLILGESGTGKEVVARNIHYHSGRRAGPFVPVNCGAIPPELLESELFGHEKGAFTGAISTRQGRFEMADGGTLFLDEIGDMPLAMQVKLLRVLQERTFERVGSNKSIRVNVRIVAATHRNLEQAIQRGTFREDLYYRLNVFPIEMPPLRKRTDDIPLLIAELVRRVQHEQGISVRFTPAAVLSLCQYPWPGNVRELANLVERLAVLHPNGQVDLDELPEPFRSAAGQPVSVSLIGEAESASAGPNGHELAFFQIPRGGIDVKEYLNNLECALIRQALDECGGIVAHAAQRLNMRRTTLVEKMRKFGLQRIGGDSTAEPNPLANPRDS